MKKGVTGEYSYQIVEVRPRIATVNRLQPAKIEITVKNTGTKEWYDVGKRSEVPEGTNRVALEFSNGQQKHDFKLKCGWEEATDRKFVAVYKKPRGKAIDKQRVVHPGEYTKFRFVITPKKFAYGKEYKLDINLGFFNTDILLSKAVPSKKIRVKVEKTKDLPKLTHNVFYKLTPGELSGEFVNKSYAGLNDYSKHTPVVMAMWQRPERLEQTIKALELQKGVKPVFYIWLNNEELRTKVEKAAKNSNLPIKIFHSLNNIGGFGRFYAAKTIASNFDRVIFIDDDQDIKSDTIKSFSDEFEPKTVKSFWAYKFLDKENYWHKEHLKAGEEADYCGTGGMIADITIFTKKELYKCPIKYWFVEDLWLSYITDTMGWKMVRTNTELKIINDGKDQMSKLIDVKTDFYKYLLEEKGWDV